MQEEIKVGDIVTVSNPGKQYSTYTEWAEKNCLRWYSGNLIETGGNYKVIAIGPHGWHTSITVLGIEDIDNGFQYIIGIDGVTKKQQDTSTEEYAFGVLTRYTKNLYKLKKVKGGYDMYDSNHYNHGFRSNKIVQQFINEGSWSIVLVLEGE